MTTIFFILWKKKLSRKFKSLKSVKSRPAGTTRALGLSENDRGCSTGLTSEIVGAPWAVFMLTAARGGQLTWLSRLEVSKLLSLNSAAAHPQNLGFGVQSRTSRIGIDGSCHGTAAAAIPTDTVGWTTGGCKESRGPGSTPTAKDDHVHQLDNANVQL